MKVIIKEIPGLPGYYASTEGSLFSTRSKKAFVNGRSCKPVKLKLGRHTKGYQRVFLRKNDDYLPCYVHRLVMLTFEGPRPNGLDVCHRDGNRTNNRLGNLYYGTRKENMEDARRHGTLCKGESIGSAKLNEAKVREIVKRIASGESRLSVSKRFGISGSSIGDILTGRTWTWLGIVKERELLQEGTDK